MLHAIHLPAPSQVRVAALPFEARGQARPAPEPPGGDRHASDRQRLLAERAVLRLAWIGLLALREGYSGPAEAACDAQPPPEPYAETVEAQLMPDIEGRAIAAYRRASLLGGPRRVRLIDTRA